MLSDTVHRLGHGSTLCFPTVEKILCRSPIVSVLWQADAKRKRGDSQEGWKPWCPSLLCARAASAHVPALRRVQLPAEVQRKTFRPSGANPPAAVRVPRSAGAEKEPPGKDEPRAQFVHPRSACAEKNGSCFQAKKKGRRKLLPFVQKQKQPKRGNDFHEFYINSIFLANR